MSAVPDKGRRRRDHGSAVENGIVRYLSVSALDKAELCLRRWWYHYIGKCREDQNSPSLIRGNKGHAEIETFYETGVRNFSSNLMAGAFMLPPPGDDLGIELDIVPPDAQGGLQVSKLRAGPTPFVGYIDLAHFREENYGVRDIELAKDAPGVFKITDWKFPGNMDRAKQGDDLRDTYQMAGYATWGFLTFPEVERIRLSHGYFPVRGQPRLATTLVERGDIEKTWKRAESLAVAIRDAARETNPDRVDANTRSCRAFNRDCPAKDAGLCTAAMHNSLSSILGTTGADRHLRKLPVLGVQNEMSDPAPNSLVARLRAQATGQAPAASVPAMTAPVLTPPASTPAAQPAGLSAFAVAPPTQDVQAELARLQAQAQTPPIVDPTTALIHEIISYRFGFPQTSGSAAEAYARAGDPIANIPPYEWKATATAPGLGGSGELAQFHIPDAVHFSQVLEEVKKMKAKRDAMVVTGTPAMQAQVAAANPTAAMTQPTPEAITQAVAPNPNAFPAPAPTPEPAPPAEGEAPKATRGPGRPPGTGKKTKAEPDAALVAELDATKKALEDAKGKIQALEIAVKNAASTVVSNTTNNVVQATPAEDKLVIYVDCLPDGVPSQSLWPLIYQIAEDLAKREGVLDLRLADPNNPNSKLAFGRWEGTVSAALHDAYTRGIIPAVGHFTIDASMTKLGQVAVEAMKDICYRNRGVIVKVTR